jgi:hypothetical protein
MVIWRSVAPVMADIAIPLPVSSPHHQEYKHAGKVRDQASPPVERTACHHPLSG